MKVPSPIQPYLGSALAVPALVPGAGSGPGQLGDSDPAPGSAQPAVTPCRASDRFHLCFLLFLTRTAGLIRCYRCPIRAGSRIPLIVRGRGCAGRAVPRSGCRGWHERKMPLGCSEPGPPITPRVSPGAAISAQRAGGESGSAGISAHQRLEIEPVYIEPHESFSLSSFQQRRGRVSHPGTLWELTPLWARCARGWSCEPEPGAMLCPLITPQGAPSAPRWPLSPKWTAGLGLTARVIGFSRVSPQL